MRREFEKNFGRVLSHDKDIPFFAKDITVSIETFWLSKFDKIIEGIRKEVEQKKKPESCPKYNFEKGQGYGCCNQSGCEFCDNKESDSRDGYNNACDDFIKLLTKE